MIKRLIFLATAVLSALVINLGAPLALAQVSQQQINNELCSGSNGDLTGNGTRCNNNTATDSINKVVHTVVNLLSAIVGIIAVIMIIVGGLRYVTSGGNDTSVTSAKNTILYAIIGLIIVAMAQILVHFTLQKVSNS